MQYGYDFTTAQGASNAYAALESEYGQRITLHGITGATMPGQGNSGFWLETTDPTITQGELDAAVTNAIGEFTQASWSGGRTSSAVPSPGAEPNMGAFLNSIGVKIRAFLASLKLPSFSWLWIVLIVIVVLLFSGIFAASFGKGLGAGVAAKV